MNTLNLVCGCRMKMDMGGAAAVLGAARTLATIKPAVSVHFIVASCENMIAGHGLRPGDILTCASGKTVEVNNTDAEGRLTLADALHYAQSGECRATRVVDVATLTGACMIALGPSIGGLFTPNDELAEELLAAAALAGEKLWRMPLEESYFGQMASPVADMKNLGVGKGGAITAALFLKQFIEENTQWAHVDIAGPAFDSEKGLGTGFASAILARWVIAQATKSDRA